MPIRPDPGSISFGKRRVAPAAPGQDQRASDSSVGLFAWSLRVSAVVGLLAALGAAQLARWNKPSDPAVRIAGTPEPETTGAITPAGAARATHLDPCLLPAADRLRP